MIATITGLAAMFAIAMAGTAVAIVVPATILFAIQELATALL